MVSIPNIIRKIKEKRGLKKSAETGEALAQAGVTPSTPQTTTGSYVTPQGEVKVDKSGGVTVVSKTTTSGGSSGNKVTQPVSNLENPTPSASVQPVENKAPTKPNPNSTTGCA